MPFQHCHFCFADKPTLRVFQNGTMVTMVAKCKTCQQDFTWKSQPYLLGKVPAGNLLLSFAILCAGSSVSKVLLVLHHMGVYSFKQATFYYQRHLLIPGIITFWNQYQQNVLESLKGKEVILAGDGRHDSMGHCAKYGTYTIFCCTVGLIIHIALVQVK